VLERGFGMALRLWLACGFAEETGIATEVLDRCKGDRFDAILDRCKAQAGNLAIRVSDLTKSLSSAT
jgi:hypothetical protein